MPSSPQVFLLGLQGDTDEIYNLCIFVRGSGVSLARKGKTEENFVVVLVCASNGSTQTMLQISLVLKGFYTVHAAHRYYFDIMAPTTVLEDIPSLETQLRAILPPALLLQVHNIRFPWPKASTLTWRAVTDNFWEHDPEIHRTLYKLLFPIWLAMSKMSLDELLRLDLAQILLDRSSTDYEPQCVGLVYLLDQTRPFFRGADMRYVHSFFDPLAARTAFMLYESNNSRQNSGQSDSTDIGIPSPSSPFCSSSWLARGWTFEDYAVRVDWLWVPLIHSELHLSSPPYRTLQEGFRRYFRSELEAHCGRSDPFAVTQAKDEGDLGLLARMTSGNDEKDPSKAKLGRELDVADYMFWTIRMNTAHFPIIDRFGRYPYQNDQMGREFQEGEADWMAEVYPRSRLPEAWREAIRKDVVAGRWTELKGDGRFD